LKLTLGSKFEHNDFTGFEIQPSGRLAYIPDSRQVIWASISRAVRTPTRLETDVQLRITPNGPIILSGNPDFHSEDLVAYELGYRVRPSRNVSFDLTPFYNVYHELRTLEPIGAGPVPLAFGNKREGNTYGFEAVARYEPFDWWELSAS